MSTISFNQGLQESIIIHIFGCNISSGIVVSHKDFTVRRKKIAAPTKDYTQLSLNTRAIASYRYASCMYKLANSKIVPTKV